MSWIEIILCFLGIPIVVLPITNNLIMGKKITRTGIIFISIVVIFAIFQVINGHMNSEKEADLTKSKDSLTTEVVSLKDSVNSLQKILLSMDLKLEKYVFIKDSLGKIITSSERPIFHLISFDIIEYKKKHLIKFEFKNDGKRTATSVVGNCFNVVGYENPQIYNRGSFPISRTEVFPYHENLFQYEPMLFNPDSTDLDVPIYFYFKLSYSDLILNTIYTYEIAVKLPPFKKGNYLNTLVYCRDWEQNHLKEIISKQN